MVPDFQKIENFKRPTYNLFSYRRTKIRFAICIWQVLNYHLSQYPEFSRHFFKNQLRSNHPLFRASKIIQNDIKLETISWELNM